MKRIAVVALLLVLASSPPAAGRAPVPNWALITLTAGSRGASGPVVIATSVGWEPTTGPFLAGFALDSAQGGRIFAHHTSGGEYRFFASVGSLRPKEKAHYVIFFPGGKIRGKPFLVSKPSRGAWRADIRVASGARTIRRAPGTAGPAFNVGNNYVGSFGGTETLRTGIIGAQVTSCEVCTGTWTTPSGSTSRWAAHTDPANVRAAGAVLPDGAWFRGPAGRWSWTLDGTIRDPSGLPPGDGPVLAAIVPVGDLWKKLG